MKNPCKDAKCISYPTCINKGIINCPILNNHIIEFKADFHKRKQQQILFTPRLWKHLNAFLPKLHRIKGQNM